MNADSLSKLLTACKTSGYASPVTCNQVIGFDSPRNRRTSATSAVFLRPSHGVPSFGRAVWGVERLAGSYSRSVNPHGCALPFDSGKRDSLSLNRSLAMTSHALVFQSTTFDIIDRNNQPWIRGLQIANALGFKNPSADISNLYDRNRDEFTDSMTALVKLPDLDLQSASAGQMREVRIFSLRGCHLLAMLSRTKIAKEFRRWVLDILDRETHHVPTPYSVNPTDSLTLDQADMLRNLLTDAVKKLPKEKQGVAMMQGWSKLKSHFGVSYRDIPQGDFTEAVSIVARHISTGEYLPAPEPEPLAALALSALQHQRFMTRFDILDGKMTPIMIPLRDNERVMSVEGFMDAADPDEIIQAAAKALQRRAA